MHDPGGVRCGEPSPRIDEGRDDLAPRTVLRVQPVLEGRAFDELDGDEQVPLVLADVVHLDDVAMPQPSERARLLPQPLTDLLIPGPKRKLQRDAPIKLGVIRHEDVRRSPRPPKPQNQIPPNLRPFPKAPPPSRPPPNHPQSMPT